MGEVVVREPRVGDGSAIARFHLENAAFYVQLAPEHFRVPDEDGLAEFMEPAPDANTETTLALVAEVDGEVAGYLEAHVLPALETARYQAQIDVGTTRLEITYVETLRKHWRRGIGSRLVEAAEAWGRERGATVAVCDTYVGSPVSIPFWEKRMGYERRAVIFRKALA